MITYQDCPNCGTRKIHSTVRLCEVCETWERAEEALNAQDEVLTAKYNQQLARAEKAEKERDEARAEVVRLQGLMHKAAVTLATTGPKWGHSGDEETGTHDEGCEACALEASIAMLLRGIDQETGGEP